MYHVERGLIVREQQFASWEAGLRAAGIEAGATTSQERVVRGVRYPVSLPSERAAQRRTLDERVFVRFSGLYRSLADALMRLLSRPQMRRFLLARLVRRAYAAANRRDFDFLLIGLDPAIEFHPRADLIAPDQDAVFYGHDGYREMWRTWLDAFEDLRLEPQEILDLGDKFLVAVQVRAHGSGSGVPMDQRMFQLFKLRQGLVVWQQDFGDRSEALEAAGLKE